MDNARWTRIIMREEMLDCATEMLDVLRLPERVVVLGHSMSAPCAFYFALAHPRACRPQALPVLERTLTDFERVRGPRPPAQADRPAG